MQTTEGTEAPNCEGGIYLQERMLLYGSTHKKGEDTLQAIRTEHTLHNKGASYGKVYFPDPPH